MFASGLEAFQKGHRDKADDRFHRALEIDPNDGPSLFYISQCRKPEQSPGGKNREGIIHLDYK
jgi:Tfp pilus assembly protein PilF